MPSNVRRFCTSVMVTMFGCVLIVSAQTPQSSPAPGPVSQTSGDVMRERISKAKAFIAVRNYNAAIYELENIRRESGDPAVHGVANVLLMNSYLEQGDYKRAQDFLNEAFKQQKTTKANAAEFYMAVAGQVVKGARMRAERYRTLGLTISDRTLPLEALNDLDKMRETVEIVITQSKEIGKTPARTSDAMMLLEEATNSRSMLARDDYDAKRWRDEMADTREALANSRSVVLSAVSGEPATVPTQKTEPVKNDIPGSELIASNGPPPAPVVMQPVVETKTAEAPAVSSTTKPNGNGSTAAAETEVAKPTPSGPAEAQTTAPPKNEGPLKVGALLGFATKQAQPIYPAAARSVRASGVVRVDVTINEDGEVAEVQNATGPIVLQAAARDAIRKWKFRPFVRDGQPVKATGFVSFNFMP